MAEEARAGVGDLLRLGARLGADRVRHPGQADPAGVTCRWARELMEREGAGAVELTVGHRSFRVLGSVPRSDAVLAARPDHDGVPSVSPVRSRAMGFLAPRALTIADGPAWTRLRALNERVLAARHPHPFAAAFLEHVRRAFDAPVADLEGVRAAMGRAMVGIVLGDAVDREDAAHEITALFDVVESPARRRLTGFLQKGRRARFYRLLGRRLDDARPDDRTLIALARTHGEGLERDELLQQIPHWMFTFTGSGTDLLARTLALVGARPQVRERVRTEIHGAGPLDRADTIERLPYLNACILEAGRLFPPVKSTFHRPAGAEAGARGDVVHWFPLLQRADHLGADVHAFRPERWLAAPPDAPADASNLFLRGPRQCPGTSLILFVCRAALARQIGELDVGARAPDRLARDPLPVSFPAGAARFHPRRTS